MNRYDAHVTDEWQRNTMVIQVRQKTDTGHTAAMGQITEDPRDGVPTMAFTPMTPEQIDGREHLVPTPGVRVPHDVAVAMARAILTEAGTLHDEVADLRESLDSMTEHANAVARDRDDARATVGRLAGQVEMLERLVEAKDVHLDREARTANHYHRDVERQAAVDDFYQARALHPASEALEVRDDAQRVAEWAADVASSTGQEMPTVVAAYDHLQKASARWVAAVTDAAPSLPQEVLDALRADRRPHRPGATAD